MKTYSRLPFMPAGHPVEYRIERMSTVPPATWARFITAVMHIYYCLPFCCRPANPRVNHERTDIYRLFNPLDRPDNVSELVFCGIPEEGYLCPVITVSRERHKDVLAPAVVESEHQMSVDLFTRMVMLALHNVCGQHFQVSSSAGACSWALPMALVNSLSQTTCFANWEAPVDARYAASLRCQDARLTEQLIIGILTGNPGITLTRQQWETIVMLEFRLYEMAPPACLPVTGVAD